MNKEKIATPIAMAVFAAVLALAAALMCFYLAPQNEKIYPAAADAPPVIVIDAGHGGADGGAVGVDGTLEKELDLDIALKLAELFRAAGYEVVMTRTEDVMLSTEGGGSAKMRDLRRRLEISSEHPDALTVSIHCNKFPDASCRGLQVYHSDGEASETVAKSIQSTVVSLLQNGNHRKVKKADSSIYLLDRATAPAVLVECGFLSNEEECRLLRDDDYRKKLALCIFLGIAESF